MNFKWTATNYSQYAGPLRQYYSLTYISSIHSLLLIGGVDTPRENVIHIFDLKNNKWRVQQTQGRKPSPRRKHITYYDQKMNVLILHGGQVDKNHSIDDFYVLFIGSWKWRKIFFQNYPLARQSHACCPWRNQLLIVGGYSQPYKHYLNDVWLVKGFNQLKLSNSVEIYGPECFQLQIIGNSPPGRYGHKIITIKDSLFMFGGKSEQIQQYFSCYSLNLSRRSWQKLKINDNFLPQLFQFQLVSLENSDELMIMGGSIEASLKRNYSMVSINLKTLSMNQVSTLEPISQKQPNNQVCVVPNSGILCLGNLKAKDHCPIWQLTQANKRIRKQSTGQDLISIEEYLINIKNQQILSQQLIKKNSQLQQLYLVLQNYITQLNSDYMASQQFDQKAEKEKEKHIANSLELKENYRKIEEIYKQTVLEIKQARMQLAAINRDFQQCMETQFDEDQ